MPLEREPPLEQMELCGGELFTFRWEGERMVRAWMPPQHNAQNETLPCLWLNDGQNVFRDEVAFGGVSWGAAGTVLHLMESGSIPRLAVVAVDHAGAQRPFDYLPVPPGDWGGMRKDMADAPGGNVFVYTERVLSELLPWAEERFGLSRKAEDRFFGGSSFGGVSALYMAMLHPEAFHGVLVESPSFWACDGRTTSDVAAHAGKPWPERVYLAMGGCEYTATRQDTGEAGSKCDRFLAAAIEECAGLLEAQGVHAQRLDWHVEPGAAHSERDWRRRLPRALRWLLGERGPAADAKGTLDRGAFAAAFGSSAAGEAPPEKATARKFWTRPSQVKAGLPFELYADRKLLLRLPEGGALKVHIGFDSWSRDKQDVPLLPAGLPKAQAAGVEWLAALVRAPEGARDLRFAVTDGTSWDNNEDQDYELQVAQ